MYTVKVIAVKEGLTNSAVATTQFTKKETAVAPTHSPSERPLATGEPQTITLTASTGATLHYTINNTGPVVGGTDTRKHENPFTVTGTGSPVIIRAIAVQSGFLPSIELIATFKTEEYTAIKVEGGTFAMGSPDTEVGSHSDERPVREVTLSDFWMSQHEVTQKQWIDLMGSWSDPTINLLIVTELGIPILPIM